MDIIDKLKNEKNAAGKAHLNLETPEEFSVSLRPDKSISLGMFRPHPFLTATFLAHPTTIRAMKKDIFAAGEDIDLTAQPYTCASCHQELDLQFWHFCPFCESDFPKSIHKEIK